MTVAATEVELVRALLAGDRSALEPFIELFNQKVFQYTWLMCGQREDAEEVAQETLMKVFESLDQLKDPAHVKGWVFRIAKNFCLMKRRRSVYAPEREYSLDELMPVFGDESRQPRFQVADPREAPEDAAVRGEKRERLEAALRELPELYRSVVLLRDVEELSTAETAQVLDISEDAVKQRLHRGRLALRRSLEGVLL